MGERIKKVFSNRIFISVSGPILTYFIVGIINSFAEKINLWESLLNLPVKIYHIKIPDFIILIFVIIIVIWLILINKKFQGLSPKKFKEMLAENERIKKHNESLIKSANNIIAVNEELKTEIGKIGREIKINKKEKLESESNEEILFVLKTLAENASRYTTRGGLNVIYEKTFEGKNQADFNIVLATLDASGQINISRPLDSDEIIRITDNGILYYDKPRKRLKLK